MSQVPQWFMKLDEAEVGMVAQAILHNQATTGGPAPTPEHLPFFTPLYVIQSLCNIQLRMDMGNDAAFRVIDKIATAELEEG